jgi:hypothetical protein
VITSTEIDQVAAALAKARGEMEQPTQNAKNPTFGKGYADLGAVQDAVTPALAKHGLCVLQSVASDNGEFVTISTMLAHESGQWIAPEPLTVPVEIPVSKNGNQIRSREQQIGALTTYHKRYALSSLLNVASEADDDGEAPAGAVIPGGVPGMPAAAPGAPVAPGVAP